ncbi:5'-nucleotidase C-terminal domain-containing protein [Paenibacillus sp. J5C_2022]|uniref:5'-nucleotidase C-terminal domain-containing protein n=1 Tax=Paenibacillus sp. J5C2022 TaxID=2977129 RepID=UPI0021CEBF9D|nr:5'-nucleotidase C-terminal domain-containing protein [Paenibacillus sp. J5C2022]MCU6711388.1 5'-nucleotidase C-terminal domain-containing protein [Paenibacillus sp. J5C2022]
MKRKWVGLGLTALMVSSLSSPAAVLASESFDLTIMHLNDHHSHLESQTYDVSLDYDDAQEGEKVRLELGGMSYISSLINEYKNDHSLYLQSGEVNGTLYFSLYKGETDIKVLNALQPDAYMVGNHEFDEGDQRLADLYDMATFPVLSGNIKPTEKSPLYGKLDKPYMIKEVNGEKVAIIGVVKIEKTKESSLVSDDVDFINEIEFVKSAVEDVKEQGINKILVLSHLGYDFDQVLAAETNDIDLIIGGDTHNLLDSSGEMKDLGLPVTGEYPTVVKNADGKDTYIVQAWEYAKVLGKIDLTFDEQGEVISAAGKPIAPVNGPYQINVDSKWVDADETAVANIKAAIAKSNVLVEGNTNPVVEEIIAPYKEAVEAEMATVIGTVKETLTNERVPKPFTDVKDANGSFAAQVVADSFLYGLPHADLAIQNAGGVRSTFLQGSFTMADAYTMLPFSNTVTTLKLTGEEVSNVLDEAIRYSQGITQSTGAFPYASHLRYDVYLNAGDDVKSVYNVEVKDRETGEWSPIDLDKTYIVATNSFTALGKDGYVTFEKAVQRDPGVKEETHIEYAVPLVELFTKYLNGGELVKPSADSYSIKSVKEWQSEQTEGSEGSESTEAPAGESSETTEEVKTYTVVKGDTLYSIAKKTLNNGMLWKQIYELNKDTIKNPSFIYPGQVIVLP